MTMDEDLLIYPDRLSTKPLVLEGDFTLDELERLEETLANNDGKLHYKVTAGLDPLGRKVVSCIIEGFVFLLCQKSLEAFRHEISLTEKLVLVDDEARLPPIEEESDAEDYLVADEPLDIRDLVEDAVLLSLPMVPRKPGLEEAQGGDRDAVRKESPFAALATLRKDK